ncbi:5-formyltetrahydrofolate cyclo-ligase [Roseicyclus persicicus]|uniref:5-formyltetrahydrofolate cyclo-ligase n=1 Tax=Roseicyclus persicicus TaxID=2650661 RepID=A0A7X6JXJ2_9RHOB|nr:5-formyltetrahydrofolate cyclo-ligase [Roseibacterium persicicum]NKX43454.1 5-formyltetrahydrofolate cyclo-ligase [Roseibacterium persicicum]
MSDVKATLRQTAYAARKAAFDARAATGAVAAATAHLMAEIGLPAGRTISGYMPIRTELDPVPAMTALHGLGARLCVPVIAGKGLPLDFRAWTPGCALTEGPFGAMIPSEGDWLTPDILIVPLVGFDAACNRLGYGGGFYDRTLARLRAAGPVRAIGLAFAAQELPALPVEPTDMALDAIVTERGVLRP